MQISPLLRWQRLKASSPHGSQFVLTIGANLIAAFIGLLTSALAARLLGPEGRGELAAIQLWPTILATVALLGLPEAVVYFGSKFPHSIGKYVASALVVQLIISIPIMVLAFILLPYLLQAQRAEVIVAARWYLFFILFLVLTGAPVQTFRVSGFWGMWNILRVAIQIIWLVTWIIAFVWNVRSVTGVIAIYLIGLGLFLIPFALITLKYISGPFTVSISLWHPMLAFGLPQAMSVLPYALNLRLDQAVIAAWTAPQLLGLYVVAVAWSTIYTIPISAVGLVLFPRMSSMTDVMVRSQVLAQTVRSAVGLTGIFMVIFMLLTPFALPVLFGNAFLQAVPAALILIPASGIISTSSILQDGLRGLGKPSNVLISEIVGLMVTFPALLALLPWLGIVGAAIASLVSYFAVLLYLLIVIGRVTQLSPVTLLIPRMSDVYTLWKPVQTALDFRAGFTR